MGKKYCDWRQKGIESVPDIIPVPWQKPSVNPYAPRSERELQELIQRIIDAPVQS